MQTSAHRTITICCSCAFYRHAAGIAEELEAIGYRVLLPETVDVMKRNDDFDVSHYKTWFADENDYPEKGRLIRAHFDEIVRGDAVLVLNDEKHGLANYIGGNVLMEMAIAFHLKKPIFLWHEFPETSAYLEEIKGMLPTLLHGDIAQLTRAFPARPRR